jgi:short-subunit dehydrogenase
LGSLQAAVANAGIVLFTALSETRAVDVERALRINVVSAHSLFRVCLSAIRESGTVFC